MNEVPVDIRKSKYRLLKHIQEQQILPKNHAFLKISGESAVRCISNGATYKTQALQVRNCVKLKQLVNTTKFNGINCLYNHFTHDDLIVIVETYSMLLADSKYDLISNVKLRIDAKTKIQYYDISECSCCYDTLSSYCNPCAPYIQVLQKAHDILFTPHASLILQLRTLLKHNNDYTAKIFYNETLDAFEIFNETHRSVNTNTHQIRLLVHSKHKKDVFVDVWSDFSALKNHRSDVMTLRNSLTISFPNFSHHNIYVEDYHHNAVN